jgi:hypothetical protein
VVVGLGIHPSVCFRQILELSDEIRSGNGVLALGTKEFRNLVLLHSEVEVCGPVASSTLCWDDISLGRSVARAVVVTIEIDVVSAHGVVIVVVLRSQVDTVSSSSGHFCLAKALKSLIKSGSVYSLRSSGAILQALSFVPVCRFLKALIDVLFLSAFRGSGSVCVPCVSLLASESAFLY